MTTVRAGRQYAYFSELPVMCEFTLNGTRAKKVSSRTLYFVDYGRKFYASKKDLCEVGNYSRLSDDYFIK